MSNGPTLDNLVKRDERRHIDLPALAFRADGSCVEIILANMSYEGCLLRAGLDFAVGEKIRLVLPRMGEIKALIRWTTADGKAGASFIAEEIAPRERHLPLGL